MDTVVDVEEGAPRVPPQASVLRLTERVTSVLSVQVLRPNDGGPGPPDGTQELPDDPRFLPPARYGSDPQFPSPAPLDASLSFATPD